MNEPTIEAWMDRHHVEVVRTHATNLDGLAVSKMLSRKKFIKSLPHGHNIADMALTQDFSGFPHLTFWHEFRETQLGDIKVKPDLDTIVPDGTDADLGHCIADFVQLDNSPLSLCPRTMLRTVSDAITTAGYSTKAAFELEFYVFKNSYASARRSDYRKLEPIGASRMVNIYNARNTYHAKPFMNEVIRRLNWQGFEWESWVDEGGPGQVELNFSPADPVTAADTISRAKQIIYEVAVDMDMSATFMASIDSGYSSGMHIHHSLQREDGSAAFMDRGERSALFHHWVAGILETMPGATSMLCPTINACRRLREFSAPPVTATWDEENRSAGLRVFTKDDASARIEHRLPSSDTNPYLALAVILAGGLAGLRHQMTPPEELKMLGWGLPAAEFPRLPTTLRSAADAMKNDQYLAEILGKDVTTYWTQSRELEWLQFHSSGADPDSRVPTPWEFERYFELI